MLKLVTALLICFSLNSYASQSQFMPDNDLWKEDSRAVGDPKLFNKVIDIGYKLYEPLALANREKLIINRLWDDATVNANVSRYNGKVTINMYGGLARRPEVNAAGFALVLCHELGHAYGGYPYIKAWNKISAEGQSDFYGAGACLSNILKELNTEVEGPITEFIVDSCLNNNKVFAYEELDICIDALRGGQSLGNLLSRLNVEQEPNYETPDLSEVEVTALSYPETTQCRLDTYYNGVLNLPRPKCWFKN